MSYDKKLPSHQKLQRNLSLYQAIQKTIIPWRIKKVFHRFLFPPYIEIVQKNKSVPSVLFVAPNIPFFDRGGTDFRLYHILEGTLQAGFSISFLSLYERDFLAARIEKPNDFLKYEESIRNIPVCHLFYGIEALRKFLRKNKDSFSAFYIIWPKTFKETYPIINKYTPHIPIIYDMVDYHALRLKREAEILSSSDGLEKASKFEIMEIESSRRADLTLAISEKEKIEFLKTNPNIKMDVLGNYFEIPDDPVPGPKNRSGLLFLGSFVHKPNADGIIWFVSKIFPLIKERHPSVVLNIVGGHPPSEIQAFSKDKNIIVHGWVPDLSDLFKSNRVMVAPLRFGAGIKGKIGISMAYGLPVVTTCIGAEGMDLVSGLNCEIADSPMDFSEKVNKILIDDEYWLRLSNEGIKFSHRTHSIKMLPSKMLKIFQAIGIRPS